MASASGYNYHRFARAVLKKARKWEPSLSIQLYPTYWRFENSEINFLYDGPMKPFLLALRSQVIPASIIPFLYDIRPPVSFVDGCLVVELQDFRKVPEIRSRVVMRPAPETLPLTIDIMLERRQEAWDDRMTLELESRIMAATSAPLYLGTSILATRNAALSLALTAPAGPNMAADGAFRPTLAAGEEEDSEAESMRKLLNAGTRSGAAGAFQPNWSVLKLLERIKAQNKQREAEARAAAAGQQREAAAAAGGGAGTAPAGEEKKKTKKKRPAEKEEEPPAKPAKKKKVAKDKEEDKKEEVKETPTKKKKGPAKKDAAATKVEDKKEEKKKDKKKDKDKEKEKEKEEEETPKKVKKKKVVKKDDK